LREPTAQVYKDDNHKPEMAVAITPFEAMCGFRSIDEIAGHLHQYPELAACVSAEAQAMINAKPEAPEAVKGALQSLLSSFMDCAPEASSQALSTLVSRLAGSEAFLEKVVCRLASQYPGDPGAMAPLFLNVLQLEPGQAFFMGANEPHAYLTGEILECMACSDNVVRAGLTPKLKDIPVLVSSLTYRSGAPDVMNPPPAEGLDGVAHRRYKPSQVDDFQVDTARLEAGKGFTLETSKGPRIILVLEGGGEAVIGDTAVPLVKGAVVFVVAGAGPAVKAGPEGAFFAVAGTQI